MQPVSVSLQKTRQETRPSSRFSYVMTLVNERDEGAIEDLPSLSFSLTLLSLLLLDQHLILEILCQLSILHKTLGKMDTSQAVILYTSWRGPKARQWQFGLVPYPLSHPDMDAYKTNWYIKNIVCVTVNGSLRCVLPSLIYIRPSRIPKSLEPLLPLTFQ